MKALPEVRGEYRYDYNLSHLTWFKVGGNAAVFYKPADVDDLAHFLKEYEKPIFVLGAGSNTIIRDGGIDSVVIKLGRGFTEIEILEGNRLKVGAAALNHSLATFCLQNGIQGFEFLCGIPGTIGGGIAMNAGCYGSEYKDIITSVSYLDRTGAAHEISCPDAGFRYRHNSLPDDLIFTSAIFHFECGDKETIKAKMDKITSDRASTQPINQKTGGSTFANPEGHRAWELIDKAGMRGYQIGGAQISPLHCNFMLNTGGAKASDLEDLGELVRAKVLEQSGIELKWEIKRVGNIIST